MGAPSGPGRPPSRRGFCLGLAALALVAASPAVESEVARGERAWAAGDLTEALTAWSGALAAARVEGDLAAEHDLLLRLASVHRALGRTQTARDAVAAASKVPLQDPLAAPRRAMAEGLIDLAEGAPGQAEARFNSAWTAFQGASQPALAANAAVNLGLARRDRGDDAGALRAFEAAIKLFTTLGDPRGEADARLGLASVHRLAGRLTPARRELELAAGLWRELGDLAGEADALANLGLVWQDLGEGTHAKELFEDALVSARGRRDLGRQASLLLSLGELSLERGDTEGALVGFRAAEHAFRDAGRPRDEVRAALRASLLDADRAALSALPARAEAAREVRVQALASLELARRSGPAGAAPHLAAARAVVERHRLDDLAWRVEHEAGLAAAHAGKPKEAIKLLRGAIERLEARRRLLGPTATGPAFDGAERVYHDLIGLLLAANDTRGAALYAARLQLAESYAAPPAGSAASLAEEAARLASVLDEARLADPDAPDSERAVALAARLDTVKADFARSVDELRAEHPELSTLVRVEPEDLEAVQGELEPGVTVLQPIVLPDRLVLLAFRRDALVARTLSVPAEEVERAAHRLARLLQAQAPLAPVQVDQLAERLGGWVLGPIADWLADTRVLVVSATGALRQVPFAALRHQGAPLITRAAVVHITHVGSLRARRQGDTFRLDGRDLLLVGNPDGSLPGAEAEVAGLGRRFPEATRLVGAAGTKPAVLAAASGKRAVHLATHGVIDPERPSRSHLVLAPGPDGEPRLSYGEIPGLTSSFGQARLVVLSACESALPVEARPELSEGRAVVVSIAGLAAQFRRAGVETLIGSLWKVDDAATRRLMDAFYGELAAGRDLARAMQAAMVSALGRPESAHPYFWAAFQVVGDWR